MAFDDDKARFMFAGTGTGSLTGSGSGTPEPVVPIHLQNEVEPLLMGPAYFARLKAAINALPTTGNPVIYLAGWWFTPLFSLDQEAGGPLIASLLKDKARAGADVRVMGWVLAPELMANTLAQSNAADAFRTSYATMRFIKELRAEPTLAGRAICNTLSHPAGAVHAKMAIVGNDDQMTAFTGGIDLVNDRHNPVWRDVQVRMTGPAVQAAFDYFRSMWNEVQSRVVAPLAFTVTLGGTARTISLDNRTSGTTAIGARSVGRPAASRIHAQSLRTVPQFNFAPLLPLPSNQSVSFAPDGAFEVDRGWRAAIAAAGTYYYVEDQMLSSTRLCDALNDRLRADNDFRVILVTGRFDPNDTPNDVFSWIRARALNFHLMRALDAGQKARIGIFNHSTKVVHSKIAIADDLWAFIGSANFSMRSQFTDFEHGYAFMDENSVAVRAFRQTLWDSIFGAPEANLAAAVQRWFDIPVGGTSGVLQRISTPIPSPVIDDLEQMSADSLFEVDSRQRWGSDLFSMLIAGLASGRFGS
jgi:phosphatidylserine/phosphatidylglycerophosphate/cardiolipin synthase-like enzyme